MLINKNYYMKSFFLYPFFLMIYFYPQAQSIESEKSDATPFDNIQVKKINKFSVLKSDSLVLFLKDKIEHNRRKIDSTADNPKIYFANVNNTEYLEIWAASDVGFGVFYSIGYLHENGCSYCGSNLGEMNELFFTFDSIRLGMSIYDVAVRKSLKYFRRFRYKNINYFYFETGTAQEIPYVPKQIYYYKFRNDKLIEMGFGRGLDGTNPMLQP